MEYGYVALWLATYLVLGLAALPLAAALLPRFPDRGAAFALPVALGTLGVVGYLVGHLAFGWVALLAATAVLVAASLRAGAAVEVDRRGAAEAAVVFAAGFLLVVAIRAVDPAVHPLGGEKFLDFGLLRSLLRADALPPEDMWFAGEPVQYYYGGHVIAALLARLTFTPPSVAYNLALAGFYGALVTAAYGLAGAIADAHGAPRRLAAGLAAFFVGLGGNLYTLGQVLLWLAPNGLARSLLSGEAATAALRWSPARFSYWDASRVIPGTINEFPLFAWLNGDLHAHMMSTPLLLFVCALLFGYWRTPEAEAPRRRFLVFGAVPLLAGYMAVVNTWSFPSAALGLTFLALAFAPASPWTLLPDRLRATAGDLGVRTNGGYGERVGLLPELLRDGWALLLAGVVVILAAGWSLPFWLSTASSRPIGTFPARAGLAGLLLVHGVFLAAFAPYLGRRVASATARPWLVAGATLVFVGVAIALDAAALALFAPLMVAAWALLRLRHDLGFEGVLILAGAGIVVLVEFVYVAEPRYAGSIYERLNTVFKTYMQVWVLWGPATGVAIARLADAGRSSFPSPNDGAWRTAGRALAVVLVFSSALFAGFALPSHFEEGSPTADEYGPTLDATAFVTVTHPGEAEAILGFVAGLEGRPNIVTAAPAGYRWNPSAGQGASAPASLTGVPTVAGWSHEAQYRSPEVYERRVADVEAIYTGEPATQRRLLAEYDVEYVYVGPAERARYGDITVGRLDATTVAHRSGDAVVYAVNQGGPES